MSGKRGLYRGVYSSLPDDPDFQTLSPMARHTLLTLRVMDEIGPGCIWRYYLGPIVQRTGYTERILLKGLEELQAARPHERNDFGWIERDSCVMWIITGLENDPNRRLSDKKHRTSVEGWLKGLPKSGIITKFCDYYHLRSPFDAPVLTHRTGILPAVAVAGAVAGEKDVCGERAEDGTSPPDPPASGPGVLDPELKKILAECPNLSLVSNGESSEFWDQVLGACEPYPTADGRWLGAKLRQWNHWFVTHPARQSRKRGYLEARLMGWLTKDLEQIARRPG